MVRDDIARQQELNQAESMVWKTKNALNDEANGLFRCTKVVKDRKYDRLQFQSKCANVMNDERQRSYEADKKAIAWARDFKRNALDHLIYGLVRMQASIKHREDIDKLRKTWRVMRWFYIEGKVEHMYIYFRLRRWLQICVRYRRLMTGMPLYHQLKAQWLCWQKWMRFLELMYMTRSPGLAKAFKHRRTRFILWSAYLRDQQLIKIHYEYQLLNPIITTTQALFLRWTFYTQRRIAFRRMTELFRRLHKIRLLKSVLSVWSTGMPMDRSYRIRRSERLQPFEEKRVLADLGVLRSWFISSYRIGLDRSIRKRNGRWKRLVQESARIRASFKASISDYEDKVCTILWTSFCLKGLKILTTLYISIFS